MSGFECDPDGLRAAGSVGLRQAGHLGAVRDYVDSTCNRMEAFSGVLNLFQGGYAETLTSATTGLADGVRVSEAVDTGFVTSAELYLDRDRKAYDLMERRLGDLVSLPPYEAPGSGQSTPGGPLAGATPPGGATDPEAGGLPDVPAYVGPLLQADDVPGGPPDLRDQARDSVADRLYSDRVAYERYQELRAQGMSSQDAGRAALDYSSDSVRDTIDYDQQQQRNADAYQVAYDQAIADGRSPGEATQAGSSAANDQASSDTALKDDAGRGRNNANTLVDGYSEAGELVENVQELGEHLEEREEIAEDRDEYDDYLNSGGRTQGGG